MLTQHRIGIIGAGPMAVFLVKHLIRSKRPLRIVILERHTLAGTGMPYRQEMSPDYMLPLPSASLGHRCRLWM